MHHFTLQASSFEFEDRGSGAGINCRMCETVRDRRFALFVCTDEGTLGPIGSTCLFEWILPSTAQESQRLAKQLDSIAREVVLRAQQQPGGSRTQKRVSLSSIQLPHQQRGWPLPIAEAGQVKRLVQSGELGATDQKLLEQFVEFGYSKPAHLHQIAALYRKHLVPEHPVLPLQSYRSPNEPTVLLRSQRFSIHLAPHIPAYWQSRCAVLDGYRSVPTAPGDEEAWAALNLAQQIYEWRLPQIEPYSVSRRSRQLTMVQFASEESLTLPTESWKDFLMAFLQRAPLTPTQEIVTGLDRSWDVVLKEKRDLPRLFETQLAWQRQLQGKKSSSVSLMQSQLLKSTEKNFLLEHLMQTGEIHALADQYLRTRL